MAVNQIDFCYGYEWSDDYLIERMECTAAYRKIRTSCYYTRRILNEPAVLKQKKIRIARESKVLVDAVMDQFPHYLRSRSPQLLALCGQINRDKKNEFIMVEKQSKMEKTNYLKKFEKCSQKISNFANVFSDRMNLNILKSQPKVLRHPQMPTVGAVEYDVAEEFYYYHPNPVVPNVQTAVSVINLASEKGKYKHNWYDALSPQFRNCFDPLCLGLRAKIDKIILGNSNLDEFNDTPPIGELFGIDEVMSSTPNSDSGFFDDVLGESPKLKRNKWIRRSTTVVEDIEVDEEENKVNCTLDQMEKSISEPVKPKKKKSFLNNCCVM